MQEDRIGGIRELMLGKQAFDAITTAGTQTNGFVSSPVLTQREMAEVFDELKKSTVSCEVAALDTNVPAKAKANAKTSSSVKQAKPKKKRATNKNVRGKNKKESTNIFSYNSYDIQ